MSTQATPAPLSADSVVSAENPWPGLLSFREADQRWFQGRRNETAELVQHIKRERLTVLFALSGLGKSSLLQAGVFPALRRDDVFPVYIRLDYAVENLDLRAQVFDALTLSTAAAGIAMPQPRAGVTLWEYFHNVHTEFWDAQGKRVLPLLVFDQFEEIFTLGKGEQQSGASDAFLEELADLADEAVPAAIARQWAARPESRDDMAETGDYKILISLREDFLPELVDQRRRIAEVGQMRYRLPQLSGEGALAAVSQAQDLVDEAVAAQIVRYVAAGERLGGGRRGRPLKELDVEPALLSVVCRELNNRRRARGERRISADLLEGEQEDVLNDFYLRSLEGMPDTVRAFVEEQLITVAGARNSVPEENALAVAGVTRDVIEQLVERRLLRKEFRRTEIRIELTHDLLTGVVRANRDLRRNAEALQKQNAERQEALRKARRSRMLAASFGTIAVAAVIAAVFAFNLNQDLKTETTAKQAQIKKTEDALAKQNQALSDREKALDQVTRESEQRRVAELQAEREKEAALESAASERSAKEETQAALVVRDQKAREAAESAVKADQQTAEAAQRAVEAIAARQAESVARQGEQEKAARLSLESAKTLANDAYHQIVAGQTSKAVANLARALTLDPASFPARSLAFDQLLRGNWGTAVTAGAGNEAFLHPALRHAGTGVRFAVFSPDGARVATAANDKTIRVWNWRTGEVVGTLAGHTGQVVSVQFTRDGRRLLSASDDMTARLWDVAAGTSIRVFRGQRYFTWATLSPNESQVATVSAGADHVVQLWNAESGEKIGEPMPHPRNVGSAVFNNAGSLLLTSCEDGQARLFATSTGRMQSAVQAGSPLSFAAFDPSGARMVTGAINGSARIWRIASSTAEGDTMQHTGAVRYVAFSPDGRRIATASDDGTARVWDAATGRSIASPLKHNSRVLSASFSPDSHRLVSASMDGTAQVWEVWYDFPDADQLKNLLEGISRTDGSQDSLAPLTEADANRKLQQVRAKAQTQPATGFIPWLLAHRVR